MCLAVPSKIVEVRDDNTAVVDIRGVKREISLELLEEEVREGDYVLVHVGFAIRKIDMEALKEYFDEYF